MRIFHNRMVETGKQIVDKFRKLISLDPPDCESNQAPLFFSANTLEVIASLLQSKILLGLGILVLVGLAVVPLVWSNTALLAVFLLLSCVLILTTFGSVTLTYKNGKRDDAKWIATVYWIALVTTAIFFTTIMITVSCILTTPLIMSIGIPIILGMVMGFGILCYLPSKGILIWGGFLTGVSADSVTGPSIFKWINDKAANELSTLNSLLPQNVHLQESHVKLAVIIFFTILILMALPALQDDKK